MATTDGSITIGTLINLDGFKEGYTKLESGIKKIASSAGSVGKSISDGFKSDSVENVSSAIMRQQALVGELREKLKALQEAESQRTAYKEKAAELWKVSNILGVSSDEAKKLRNELSSMHLPPEATTSAEELSLKLSIAEKRLGEMKDKAEQTGASSEKVGKAWRGVAQTLGKVGKTVGGAAKKVAQLAYGLLTVGKNANKSGKNVNGLNKAIESTLKRIKQLLVSALVFNVLRNAFKDFKDYVGVALKQNQKFVNSFGQVRANLATAFQPILQVVVPALAALMGWLAQATQYVVQFMAALSGKSVKSMQNAAKNMDALTESAKKEKKAMQALLGPMDEINQITKDMSDSGENASIAPVYEDIPDLNFAWLDELREKLEGLTDSFDRGYAIGAAIAEQINGVFDLIDWDYIQKQAQEIAEKIAGFLSGAVETLSWDGLGSNIGEGINTALTFLNTFFSSFNWAALGQGLANGLNSIIATVDWQLLGEYLANRVNALFDTIGNFIRTFDWVNLGLSLASGLASLFSNIRWAEIGTSIGEGITGLLMLIYTFFTSYDWGELGRNVGELLNNALHAISWEMLGQTLGSIINAAFNFVRNLISTYDWVGLGAGIAAALNNLFATIDWGGIGETISTAIISIFNMISEFLAKVDWVQIGRSIAAFLAGIDWVGVITALFEIIWNVVSGALQGLFGLMTSEVQTGMEPILAVLAGIWVYNTAKDIIGFFKKMGSALSELATNFSLAEAKGALLGAAIGVLVWGVTTLVANWDKMSNAEKIVGVLGALSIAAGAAAIAFGALQSAWTLGIAVAAIVAGIVAITAAVNSATNRAESGGFSESDFSSQSFMSSQSIGAMSVPHLATGTVVPPNKEFMAVLGDNTREHEIVSPKSTMKQSFKEAIEEMGGVGGGEDIVLNISTNLDGQVIYQNQQKVKRQRGYNSAGMGAFAR